MRSTPPGKVVALLRDDALAAAEKIQNQCATETCAVWVDVNGRIHLDDPSRLERVLPAAVVGTYALGVELEHIADDIREHQRACARTWLRD